jgi:hypothetical protein
LFGFALIEAVAIAIHFKEFDVMFQTVEQGTCETLRVPAGVSTFLLL